MTETTSEEQVQIWKEELATAVTGQQWQLALKLCSWLRHELGQQDASDPEVEEAHRQAKEGLAEHGSTRKTEQESEKEHRRTYQQRRIRIMHQLVAGNWDKALDLIEALHQDGATRHQIVDVLHELSARTASLLSPGYRRVDARAAALGQTLDEFVERVQGGPLTSAAQIQDRSTFLEPSIESSILARRTQTLPPLFRD